MFMVKSTEDITPMWTLKTASASHFFGPDSYVVFWRPFCSTSGLSRPQTRFYAASSSEVVLNLESQRSIHFSLNLCGRNSLCVILFFRSAYLWFFYFFFFLLPPKKLCKLHWLWSFFQFQKEPSILNSPDFTCLLQRWKIELQENKQILKMA